MFSGFKHKPRLVDSFTRQRLSSVSQATTCPSWPFSSVRAISPSTRTRAPGMIGTIEQLSVDRLSVVLGPAELLTSAFLSLRSLTGGFIQASGLVTELRSLGLVFSLFFSS